MFDPLYAFPHTADKLRTRLAREGVPHLWRGHVWYHLLTHQSRLCDPPDDPHAHAALDAEILTELVDLRGRPSKHQGLIEADVDEAFPNHVLFIEGFGGGAAEGDEAEGEEGGNGETGMGPPRSKGRAQLERLLTAFVQGERRFGYWRGLSKIAAMLVLVMEEERAYIALSHLFHTPPPPSVPSPLPPPAPLLQPPRFDRLGRRGHRRRAPLHPRRAHAPLDSQALCKVGPARRRPFRLVPLRLALQHVCRGRPARRSPPRERRRGRRGPRGFALQGAREGLGPGRAVGLRRAVCRRRGLAQEA
ncbi:rab-GTPase-TBC domain-containing protein [Zopfochytrium polystomum]|nr:rab-GTPase-TBC domain-containing protein [Zopfochytrium polystomum]